MNIALTPKQEEFINKLVEEGKYLSASDVIDEGLRLLEDRYIVYQARLAELQKKIDVGIEQLERGERIDGETAIQQLREKIVGKLGQQ
ncbi:MAG TPA: type II toxin-antitoxin system ParD family antitoxin [Leptolyngbyaceae cyanobacterium]